MSGLKTRHGADADCDNLRYTLRSLDFEVKVYEDAALKTIQQVLEELANEDHSGKCLNILLENFYSIDLICRSNEKL